MLLTLSHYNFQQHLYINIVALEIQTATGHRLSTANYYKTAYLSFFIWADFSYLTINLRPPELSSGTASDRRSLWQTLSVHRPMTQQIPQLATNSFLMVRFRLWATLPAPTTLNILALCPSVIFACPSHNRMIHRSN